MWHREIKLVKYYPNRNLTLQSAVIFSKGFYNLLIAQRKITLRSRKTLPCTKGIKTNQLSILENTPSVERHCPVRKGLRPSHTLTIACVLSSRKTLPCTKGIKTIAAVPKHHVPPCRKTLPCTKGIKTFLVKLNANVCVLSKDIALYERD